MLGITDFMPLMMQLDLFNYSVDKNNLSNSLINYLQKALHGQLFGCPILITGLETSMICFQCGSSHLLIDQI